MNMASTGSSKFLAAGDSRPRNLQDLDFTSTDEPELEFDEDGTELSATKEGPADFCSPYAHIPSLPWDVELAKDAEGGAFRGGAITPDGYIDEDFEKELGTPSEEEPHNEFSDVERFGIVEVAGDDLYGRKVIVLSACKLPSNKTFDHQRLLQYLKHTLDKYVEQDYVLVYFHHGLHRGNKPKLSWLLQAYREIDRKYKKNLKMMYLVHPTNFIKVLWNIFRPIISVKVGSKMMYVNYLVELKRHLPFDQLAIPQPVLEFDAQKVAKNKLPYPYDGSSGPEPKKAQQFGLSLQEIKQNTGRIIPLPVQDTVEFLKASGADEVKGLFRRCGRVTTMREVQEKYDDGEAVDFESYGDPHLAAAILKKFLRELQEPLMTFDLFEPLTRLHFMEQGKQLTEVQRILKDELPEDNYIILKFVFQFLQQVVDKSDINQMNAENVATVFGPNIAWPKGQANLASVEQAVKFALILIQSFDDVFLR
ncbi:rho GTPase-activating protein 8 isoform X2 [Aplysia californica]|uniref:Rho GTPase-activating protein 8 isoform X2 n=1 Tax=Aplysia californica TaxID=6500 RepID=A0ABM1VUY5_APLCA|nr:rho GTPase-activating protein 8 isoform X2 [Aplysia californica]